MPKPSLFVVVVCVAAGACSTAESKRGADGVPGPTPSVQRTPIGELPEVDVERVLTHTTVLSSDQYEGRGPGTKGEELAVAYITDQFRKMALKPGNPDGTYVQKVPLVGITPTPAPLVLKKGSEEKVLRWKDDVVAWTKHVAPSAAIENSELVFVGYGIVAPEFQWDDYKGVDVRGKTLVMLVNDPPVKEAGSDTELDAKVFGGKAMTYYGRWTYKYEIAAKMGAAGVLLIHETGPAGYPFGVVQSKVEEQFDLVTPDKNMGRVNVEGWISQPQGEALLKMGGQDFAVSKAKAATREFTPVPLRVRASMTIKNTLRTIDSRNVVGKIEGSDPRLKNEYVVFSAHWDHLGVGTAVKGDAIYNGAKDNASGTAGMIEIARALTRLPTAPRRSVLFLAVTAEEQGLLGSQYYAVMPLYPLAKTAANINLDELNVNGRTRDITLIGLGASELDDYARDAAGEQGRVIRGDPEPEKGFYYRSDHFSFAKQGVPALDPVEGIEYLGKPLEFGQQVLRDYNEHDYHQPSDVVKPSWDLSGAREDLKIFLAVGYRVANADRFPEWRPGNEFRATREAMLKK
ncbi:MAG: M28 family metallopeptidase [Vicinamibacterales bacterium]